MKTKSKLVLGLSILSAATLAAGATSTFAWYVAASATFNTIAETSNIATAAETVGAISLTASWSAKKTNTNDDFALTGAKPDKLSLVDWSNGNTYVYAGTADPANKKTVATRAGIQYAKVTVTLTGTVNSSQYGTYTGTVSAGSGENDILYLQDATNAIAWDNGQDTAEFSKSLEFTVAISADSVNVSYSFWVIAKGLEVDQTTTKNSGSLSVSVA